MSGRLKYFFGFLIGWVFLASIQERRLFCFSSVYFGFYKLCSSHSESLKQEDFASLRHKNSCRNSNKNKLLSISNVSPGIPGTLAQWQQAESAGESVCVVWQSRKRNEMKNKNVHILNTEQKAIVQVCGEGGTSPGRPLSHWARGTFPSESADKL